MTLTKPAAIRPLNARQQKNDEPTSWRSAQIYWYDQDVVHRYNARYAENAAMMVAIGRLGGD